MTDNKQLIEQFRRKYRMYPRVCIENEIADALDLNERTFAQLEQRIEELEVEIDRRRETYGEVLAENERLRGVLEKIERNLGMPADWYRIEARKALARMTSNDSQKQEGS